MCTATHLGTSFPSCTTISAFSATNAPPQQKLINPSSPKLNNPSFLALDLDPLASVVLPRPYPSPHLLLAAKDAYNYPSLLELDPLMVTAPTLSYDPALPLALTSKSPPLRVNFLRSTVDCAATGRRNHCPSSRQSSPFSSFMCFPFCHCSGCCPFPRRTSTL